MSLVVDHFWRHATKYGTYISLNLDKLSCCQAISDLPESPHRQSEYGALASVSLMQTLALNGGDHRDLIDLDDFQAELEIEANYNSLGTFTIVAIENRPDAWGQPV